MMNKKSKEQKIKKKTVVCSVSGSCWCSYDESNAGNVREDSKNR